RWLLDASFRGDLPPTADLLGASTEMRSESGLVGRERHGSTRSFPLVYRNGGVSSAHGHRHRKTDGMMAVKEVAAELRLSTSAVYKAIETGALPALRLSPTGAIRVHRSALD